MKKKVSFSYASNIEHNFAQRLIIKTIEQLTGKRKLEKIYREFSKEQLQARYFWSGILNSMQITVKNKSKKKLDIPSSGSLIIIANHPFGIIDGLILCSLASKVRDDFKIMTHETLKFLPELDKYILPVDFNETSKATLKNNLKTAIKAKQHLINKGLLIIFPSGSVSIAKNLRSSAQDDKWKNFPAKLIMQTKSDVLPIYFDGKNGIMFHLFASKLKNQTLKYSSYIHETKKKIGKEITLYSGELIKYSDLSNFESRQQITDYLKYITYNLKISTSKKTD